MTTSIVTALIAVVVVSIPAALLAFVVLGGFDGDDTEQETERERHYIDRAGVYDHPRSTR